MNKYQEAYEYLLGLLTVGDDMRWPLVSKSMDAFKKLIDKETPKKPIKEIIFDAYDCDDRNIDFEWERTKCPHCDDDLINEYENRDFEDYDYCPCCGGRLDWSDE